MYNSLQKKTIVITRDSEQFKDAADIFTMHKAEVINFPAIKIVPIKNKNFDDYLLNQKKIDLLLFTSANSVKYFSSRIKKIGIELNYKNIFVAAVGIKTAECCGENNIPVQFVPQKHSAAGLMKELSNLKLKNKVVVIPKSKIGSDELKNKLQKFQATVEVFPIYDVTLPDKKIIESNKKKLKTKKIDWFIFTSPSTFNNFLIIMKIENPAKYFTDKKIAVIGTTTKNAVLKADCKVDLIPKNFNMNGIVESLLEYYNLN